MISKKNIRYLGTLYSINEQNATVALQNVRSYGTEGREEDGKVIEPSDAVHPFLLFRGQDIKDLHVHEEQAKEEKENKEETPATKQSATKTAAATAPAAKGSKPAAPAAKKPSTDSKQPAKAPSTRSAKQQSTTPKGTSATTSTAALQAAGRGGGRGGPRNNNTGKPRAAPGTGASLLHRTARGTNNQADVDENYKQEFDFQTNLEEFQKEQEDLEQEDEDAGDELVETAYEKDDFFDSISSDATDRANGIDNRLRGRQERSLNTETFGAVALNHGGRGRRGRGGRYVLCHDLHAAEAIEGICLTRCIFFFFPVAEDAGGEDTEEAEAEGMFPDIIICHSLVAASA